ncbi:hypothetical protein RSOL_269840, partial [Rhizoctonia solani AG-3 Rhs1AP]
MSDTTHRNGIPVDPALAFHAGAYGFVPPGAPFPPLGAPIPPPGAPIPPGAPMSFGPPAVLLDNVLGALEPIRQEFQHVVETMKGVSEANNEMAASVKELTNRIQSLEATVQKLDLHTGSDADDEEEDGEQPRPAKRQRGSKEPKKQTEGKSPPSEQRELMFPIVRKALYSGCGVSDMKELKEGLSGEELKTRITEDPASPWRPDFLKPLKDPDNSFWLEKIIAAVLDHPDAKTLVGEEENKISPKYWTRECIQDYILSVVWNSAKRAVQRKLDPEKDKKAQETQNTNNKKSRRERLFKNRYLVAAGDDSHPPLKVVIDKRTRVVPQKLMVPEIMSDVVEETFGHGSLPPGVVVEEYKKGRAAYKYEGVTPFYRHKMWNDVFAEMDDALGSRGTALKPRYYASKELRGQRDEKPEMAIKIPVRQLYRCHISTIWYDRLPETMKKLVKPSPKGWEVGEEVKSAEHTDLGADQAAN